MRLLRQPGAKTPHQEREGDLKETRSAGRPAVFKNLVKRIGIKNFLKVTSAWRAEVHGAAGQIFVLFCGTTLGVIRAYLLQGTFLR